jgi:hypothetical protein
MHPPLQGLMVAASASSAIAASAHEDMVARICMSSCRLGPNDGTGTISTKVGSDGRMDKTKGNDGGALCEWRKSVAV